jgi:hypothetical protein
MFDPKTYRSLLFFLKVLNNFRFDALPTSKVPYDIKFSIMITVAMLYPIRYKIIGNDWFTFMLKDGIVNLIDTNWAPRFDYYVTKYGNNVIDFDYRLHIYKNYYRASDCIITLDRYSNLQIHRIREKENTMDPVLQIASNVASFTINNDGRILLLTNDHKVLYCEEVFKGKSSRLAIVECRSNEKYFF